MFTRRSTHDAFELDSVCLARHLLAQEHGVFGFDCHDSTGRAPAAVARFYVAEAAEAIRGPIDAKVHLYALNSRALIVGVRKVPPPAHLSWPLRQLATYQFDADEIAPPGDSSFKTCVAGLEELLARANALLPDLRALDGVRAAAA
jgi:hypothetical protein